MVFAGIDVGNATSCVAISRSGQREIKTAQNLDGLKETNTIVQYGPKMRAVGFKAIGGHASNAKNTVTQAKRLIGRDYATIRRDDFLFDVTEAPATGALAGRCMVSVPGRLLSPEQVLVSVLKDLKQTADREARGSSVGCVVLSVPCFYGQAERLAMLGAAEVAGLKDVTLMHELTAAAVEWVATRPQFPEILPRHVAFVDVGYSATQVCIASVGSDGLQILAHAWDMSVGGHDLDGILIQHFAQQFQTQTSLNVMDNPKAVVRMAKAVAKCRHLLTVDTQADLAIDNLLENHDLRSSITRVEFEKLAGGLLGRVKTTLQDALRKANLQPKDIHAVERVGGASRTPAIVKVITQVFGLKAEAELKSTINQKECVARGCAIHAAVKSRAWFTTMPTIRDVYPSLLHCSILSVDSYTGRQTPVPLHLFTGQFGADGRPAINLSKMSTNYLQEKYANIIGDIHILGDPVSLDHPNHDQEPQKIITVKPPKQNCKHSNRWHVYFYLDCSGVITVDAQMVVHGKLQQVEDILKHRSVPGPVISQWHQEEEEMDRHDREQLGKDRARNELERCRLQLQRRVGGEWAPLLQPDEVQQLDSELSKADELLGSGEDVSEQVYQAALERLEQLQQAVQARRQPPQKPPATAGHADCTEMDHDGGSSSRAEQHAAATEHTQPRPLKQHQQQPQHDSVQPDLDAAFSQAQALFESLLSVVGQYTSGPFVGRCAQEVLTMVNRLTALHSQLASAGTAHGSQVGGPPPRAAAPPGQQAPPAPAQQAPQVQQFSRHRFNPLHSTEGCAARQYATAPGREDASMECNCNSDEHSAVGSLLDGAGPVRRMQVLEQSTSQDHQHSGPVRSKPGVCGRPIA